MKVTKNTRRSQARIAIVVSKKIHKGAVGRNKIRRRLYELIRQTQPAVVQAPIDLVIIVTSPDTLHATRHELQASLTSQLVEAGLYKPD